MFITHVRMMSVMGHFVRFAMIKKRDCHVFDRRSTDIDVQFVGVLHTVVVVRMWKTLIV